MAGEVEFDSLTIQHIVSVPDALLNAPGISAMHAIRARSLLQSDAADALPRLHGLLNLNEIGRCPSCGHLRVGSTRIQRLHTRRIGVPNKGAYTKARVVRWTCSKCHFVLETPIAPSPGRIQHSAKRRSHGTAAIAGEVGKEAATTADFAESNATSIQQRMNTERGVVPLLAKSSQAQSSGIPKPSISIVAAASTSRPGSSPAPTPSGAPARSKSRPKNKSSLQALLAQNRKREAENAAAKSQTGLGAFLDSL